MSIYRGAGGASDATDDSTVNAVAGYASAAAASATSAANSATDAATSAGAAATSASEATTQVSLATAQASNAASSASSAASSVTSAAAQASAASTSASAASSSASSASTSASAASTSATNAATSATAASGSATTASTQATNSAASAASALAIYGNTTAMNNAVTASQTAATNAATSASSAATSAADALASSADASVYADNANASYVAAAASAAAAATTVAGFDGNVAVAVSSAASASASASAAASNATNSANSAVQAASSAAGATAIVLGAASTRASIRPSLLLDFASTRVLDPRVTFTRAGAATFYDKHTSAVAEQNLLIYSQEFDNAAWVKTTSTVTANAFAAPNATTTAAALLATGANSTLLKSFTSVGSAHTFSLYIYRKTGTGNVDITVDGTTWVPVTITAGWVRYETTLTPVAGTRTAGIRLATSGDEVYVWGAQVERNSSATAYTPTTTQIITNYIPVLQTAASDAARFDCSPVTRESFGLLIEEARTNLVTYSDQFDNASWTKNASLINANAIVSPGGSLTGDKFYEDATNASHEMRVTISSAGAITYTWSVYAKAGERNVLRLLMPTTGNTSGNVGADFNLTTGTITTAGATSSTITPVGNNWYRCVITATTAAGATAPQFRLVLGNTVYTGDGYSGLYIWGAQLEAGAFATSYIPTTSAQVTRAADSFTMSGTNFSSWYNQAEGTISVTAINKGVVSDSTLYSIDDGTTGQANTFDARYTTFGIACRPRVRSSGTTEVDAAFALFPFGTQQQVSFGYKVNDFAASQSGAAPVTDALGVLPLGTMTRFRLGGRGTGAPLTQLYVSRFAYYPERLSNTELQGITS